VKGDAGKMVPCVGKSLGRALFLSVESWAGFLRLPSCAMGTIMLSFSDVTVIHGSPISDGSVWDQQIQDIPGALSSEFNLPLPECPGERLTDSVTILLLLPHGCTMA
jgi:hypothetical protein